MGKKTQKAYFEPSPVALRHPKTDLLILARLLKDEGTKQFQDEDHVTAAYKIVARWADMEASSRLVEFKETELQGLFLSEVFGQALGYTPATEGSETFYQVQHHSLAADKHPMPFSVSFSKVLPAIRR
jgi:hypothetical protein